jgi:hypothetical protein
MIRHVVKAVTTRWLWLGLVAAVTVGTFACGDSAATVPTGPDVVVNTFPNCGDTSLPSEACERSKALKYWETTVRTATGLTYVVKTDWKPPLGSTWPATPTP